MYSRRLFPPPSDLPIGYTKLEYVSGPIVVPYPLTPSNSVYLDYSVNSFDSRFSPRSYLFMGGTSLPNSGQWFAHDARFASLIFDFSTTGSVQTSLRLVEPSMSDYTQITPVITDYAGRHKVYFHPEGGSFDSTLLGAGTGDGFWLGLFYTPASTTSGAVAGSVGVFYEVSVIDEDGYVFYGIPCSDAEGVEGIYDAIGREFYARRRVCTITLVSSAIFDTSTGGTLYRYRSTFPPLSDVTVGGPSGAVYPAGVTEAKLSGQPFMNYSTSPLYDDRYFYVYGGDHSE